MYKRMLGIEYILKNYNIIMFLCDIYMEIDLRVKNIFCNM